MSLKISDYKINSCHKTTETIRLVHDSFSQESMLNLMLDRASKGLWDYEKKIVNRYFKSEGSVLCIGCGAGRESIAFSKLGYKVTGIDISEQQIENAKNEAKKHNVSINFKICDGTTLEFNDKYFDHIVLWSQVFGNIPSHKLRTQFLIECCRCMKNHGILSFTGHDLEICRQQNLNNNWTYSADELGFNPGQNNDFIYRNESWFYHLFTRDELILIAQKLPVRILFVGSTSDLMEETQDEVNICVCQKIS